MFQSASWEVCARPSVPTTAAPSRCANAVWARRCQLVSNLGGQGSDGARALVNSSSCCGARRPRQPKPLANALDFCLIALINFAKSATKLLISASGTSIRFPWRDKNFGKISLKDKNVDIHSEKYTLRPLRNLYHPYQV